MYNKYILIFLLVFDLVLFFPLYFKVPLQRHKNFLFYKRKIYIRQKQLNETAETTENELK